MELKRELLLIHMLAGEEEGGRGEREGTMKRGGRRRNPERVIGIIKQSYEI